MSAACFRPQHAALSYISELRSLECICSEQTPCTRMHLCPSIRVEEACRNMQVVLQWLTPFFFSWSWNNTGMRWSSKKKKGSFLLCIRLNVAEFHTKPGRESCFHGDGRRGRGGPASESFSYVTEAH